MQTNAAGLQPSRDIEQTVSRAFRTAHLLTASIRQAESAVLEAIDSFDPDVDTAESLFQNAILAAVRCPSSESQSNESFEPLELQAVLNLSENLRRCFVLRVLVGLSHRSCARLLRLSVGTVNEYTCAALQRLAGIDQ
jgi:DNA-directed RNA polymerase specialized sigma24 family protein